ncbi:MAG: pyridoxal phosphate-dependent aminotransferase, partial [Acidobacteriota bacterium]
MWAVERYNHAMIHRSRRIPADLSLNRLAEAREGIGEILYDLTVSNPTLCGFSYPETLMAPLAARRGSVYEPIARGPSVVRDAVAGEYARWGVHADPHRVVLTTSTSEAYSFLFRLFCNPGERVLVPSPSYPLFDHLANLDCVDATPYALDPDANWRIDFSALEEPSEEVRAVTVVHPNNPTGSFIHPDDRERLVDMCRHRGWALIADEVFFPYPLDEGPGSGLSFASVDECLCCTLGGLSKSAGLPQLKLSWINVTGPSVLVEPVLEGLEYIADAYLSVSTPVALASPQVLADAGQIRGEIANRCQANLDALRRLSSAHPEIDVGPIGGGWSAPVRVPSVVDEEDLCVKLLLERSVAVHPGRFFGFARDGWLVLSLLPPIEVFGQGVR